MAANTVTTFAGYLKTNYAAELINTIPEDLVLQRDTKFSSAQKIGEQYQQAVITKLEQGAGYAAGGGSVTIPTTSSGTIEKALVDGYQFVLASGINYETLAKAVSAGKLAYGGSGDQLMRNMTQSARKRLEIELWMGQFTGGLGIVSGTTSTDQFTITPATWCPGFWIGMEGAALEVFDSALTTQRAGACTVESVNIATRTITVDAAFPSGTTATDVVFYDTMRYSTSAFGSMFGLLALAGTSSGTLWNISTTTKSIWAPNQYNVAGVLSFSKLQAAMVTAAYKGLMGTCKAYIPVSSWNNLLTEQSAMRRYDGEFSGRVELVNGGQALMFQTMCGRLEIVPTIYLPDGYGVIVPDKSLVRVGATDVTFSVPGMKEPLLVHSATATEIELRCYYNQALFCPTPGKITQLYGITVT